MSWREVRVPDRRHVIAVQHENDTKGMHEQVYIANPSVLQIKNIRQETGHSRRNFSSISDSPAPTGHLVALKQTVRSPDSSLSVTWLFNTAASSSCAVADSN